MKIVEIMQFCEGQIVPQWLMAGRPVGDPAAFNDDCNDILEPEEYDWTWRLCDIPRQEFKGFAKPNFIKQADPENNSEFRFARIRSATGYSPIITAFKNGKLVVLDGYHRIQIIARERKSSTVRALVGLPKVTR